MKLKLSAAKFDGGGVCILLEDEDGDFISIYEDRLNPSIQDACDKAEQTLQRVIFRLRHLAATERPFHDETHDAINDL